MKSCNEIVSEEGKINSISTTENISHRLLVRNMTQDGSKSCKNNNIIKRNQINSLNALSLKDSIILKKHFTKLKSMGSNSTASISLNNEKIKKVTFSTVSIIRIKNYKQYNKLNSYRSDEARNNWEKREGCHIF